jgi:hypothetical protein
MNVCYFSVVPVGVRLVIGKKKAREREREREKKLNW